MSRAARQPRVAGASLRHLARRCRTAAVSFCAVAWLGVGPGCAALGTGPTPTGATAASSEPAAAFVLRPEPGRALIVVGGQLQQPPRVEYWVTCEGCAERPQPDGVVVAQPCAGRWVAELSDLPRGRARVSYRVRSSDGDTGPASFTPGALTSERFRFAALGNTWGSGDVHGEIVQAIRAERVDFVIHTGSVVESPERAEQWTEFFRIERPLLTVAPIFPALGSRDASRNDPFVSMLWTDTLPWYHQDWGNLRVVTVDTEVACSGGCLELDYVNAALAEGARRGMLLMIVLATAPYASAGREPFPALRATIVKLAREHGVEVVLAGGVPHYERTQPIHGTTYIVTGSAGAPSYPVTPRAFSQVIRVEPSYVVFDVAPDGLSVRAVGASGNVIDSTVIKAVRPSAAPERGHWVRPARPDASASP